MRDPNKLVARWFGRLLTGRPCAAGLAPAAIRPKKRGRRRRSPLSGPIEKLRTLRILIVDDEPQVAAALKRLLHRHDVVIANSGSDARRALASAEFDVIVSDVMMPEPSGIDVYLELAAQGSPVVERFIFVTGGVHGQKAQKFLAAIPNPRLEKPVDALELDLAIARVVHGTEEESAGAG
jgi:CheY-like chemotaxis protein